MLETPSDHARPRGTAAGEMDWFIAVLDRSDLEVSSSYINGTRNDDQAAKAVVVTSDGDYIVAGETWGEYFEENAGSDNDEGEFGSSRWWGWMFECRSGIAITHPRGPAPAAATSSPPFFSCPAVLVRIWLFFSPLGSFRTIAVANCLFLKAGYFECGRKVCFSSSFLPYLAFLSGYNGCSSIRPPRAM